jgi:hypothetical protein
MRKRTQRSSVVTARLSVVGGPSSFVVRRFSVEAFFRTSESHPQMVNDNLQPVVVQPAILISATACHPDFVRARLPIPRRETHETVKLVKPRHF